MHTRIQTRIHETGNTCEVVLPHEQNHGSALRPICILMAYMLHGRTLKDMMLLISYYRLLALSAEVWGPREGQMNLRPWAACVHRYKNADSAACSAKKAADQAAS